MKQVLYIVLMISFVIGLTSCQKQERSSENESGKKLYMQIATISNLAERRLAFTALNPEEKFSVWEYRFSLMTDQYKSSQAKVTFIRNLHKEFLKYTYLPIDEQRRHTFSKEVAPLLYQKALEIFGSLDAMNIIYQLVPLSLSEIPKKTVTSANNGGTYRTTVWPDCECILDEPGGCWIIVNNQVVYGTCFDPQCIPPAGGGGCGPFGYQTCNGYNCHFE